MIKYLFALWSIFITMQVIGQDGNPSGTTNTKAEKLFHEGLAKFQLQDLNEANKLLDKALKLDENYPDALMLSAEIAQQQNNDAKALQLYERIIQKKPKYPFSYFKASEIYFKQKNYTEAYNKADAFLAFEGDFYKKKSEAKHIKNNAEFAAKAIKSSIPFNPINLGNGVNSMMNDYFPTLTADGNRLFFTRLENGMNEEFYSATRINGNKWSVAQNVGSPINTIENEGASCLSADGQYIFFTACNRRSGLGSCDIYLSKLDGSDWSNPVNIGAPINTANWESQPCVNFDAKTLYFSSNRPGGYGKSDIWKSTFANGKWSAPINLGPEINSDGEEQSPYIAKDDKTLYFTSDGHPGMGGMDLFIARKANDGRWNKPENLGYPINSSEDELSLSLDADGSLAYFVAEREGGLGGLDIYSFDMPKHLRPENTAYVKGIVYDAKTKKKLSAHIELTDIQTGKTIVESYSNKQSGEFLICLPGNHEYAFNASLNGYLFYSGHFSLKNEAAKEPQIVSIPMNPILAGEKIVLNNIFFDTDKSVLKEESKIELLKLYELLKNNPNTNIEISGHTDNQGDLKRNQALSNNRAKSVYDFLVQQGIIANRLQYKGYADSQPIAENSTEKGRSQNRRTEIKIIR